MKWDRISKMTRICISASMLLLILLICNYEFARYLYAYSFDPSYWAAKGTINYRDWVDIEPEFGFPEDRAGGILFILFLGSTIASIKLFRNDIRTLSQSDKTLS
jgi:hypothetical protein